MTLRDIRIVVEIFTDNDCLRSKSKARRVSDARTMYAALARKYTTSSVVEIAKEINRKHPVVIYMAHRHNNLIRHNAAYRDVFQKLRIYIEDEIEIMESLGVLVYDNYEY